MKVEGNAEGVPYGLQLMGVNDKTVKLSWISPERPMATSMIRESSGLCHQFSR